MKLSKQITYIAPKSTNESGCITAPESVRGKITRRNATAKWRKYLCQLDVLVRPNKTTRLYGNGVGHNDQVTLRRARLVLRWMTVRASLYRLSK